jgi:hypothetical protein
MTRRTIQVMVAVALAALVAGMPAEAEARRKKGRVSATVNGKRVKFPYNVSITAGGDTVAFFLVAQTRPRLRRLLRTIGVGCADFPPAATPATLQYCTANYQETRLSANPAAKAWTTQVVPDIVTIDSYDGTNVTGRFGAVLESLTGDPPVTVEGQFRGRITPAQ